MRTSLTKETRLYTQSRLESQLSYGSVGISPTHIQPAARCRQCSIMKSCASHWSPLKVINRRSYRTVAASSQIKQPGDW